MSLKIKDIVELITTQGITGATNQLSNSPLAAQSNHFGIKSCVQRVKSKLAKLKKSKGHPGGQAALDAFRESDFIFPRRDPNKNHARLKVYTL